MPIKPRRPERRYSPGGPGHRKALAVVADCQIGVIILEVDQDLDPSGPGMGLGIAQGFLGDFLEGDLRLRAGPFRITFDDEARRSI